MRMRRRLHCLWCEVSAAQLPSRALECANGRCRAESRAQCATAVNAAVNSTTAAHGQAVLMGDNWVTFCGQFC